MLFAGIVRFWGIGEQNLWYDEVCSLDASTWPLDTLLFVDDGHPPLFHLLQKSVIDLVPARLAGRYLAALFGILGVGAMYGVGRRMFDKTTGLIAAALLAISPLHIWYSREGRMYSLAVLFAITSSYFLAVLVGRARRRDYFSYAAATIGGICTHYAYIAIFAAQALFVTTTL